MKINLITTILAQKNIQFTPNLKIHCCSSINKILTNLCKKYYICPVIIFQTNNIIIRYEWIITILKEIITGE